MLKKHGDGFARLLDAHTEDNECLVVNTYPVECDVAEAIDRHIHFRFLKSQVCRETSGETHLISTEVQQDLTYE